MGLGKAGGGENLGAAGLMLGELDEGGGGGRKER